MGSHKLIILRHGALEWNNANKFGGWIDVPLSERGRKEARAAAQMIKDHNFKPSIVYTSKLSRSIQTADEILLELGREWCDMVKTWRLNERHYGEFQGKDKNTIYNQLGPDKFKFIRRDFDGLPPPLRTAAEGGIDERYDDLDIPLDQLPKAESLRMVMDRLIPYFKEEILDNSLVKHNRTVLIVTHGSVVRALIKYFDQVADADISHINVPTGVPLVYDLDDWFNPVTDHYYLDPDLARCRMEKVSREGSSTL